MEAEETIEMKKLEPLKLWFFALMLIAFFGARPIVSNAQTQDGDVSAPMVSATSPENGAIAVTLNQAIAVTFSQEMSGPSMDMSLILLGPDGNPVSGTVNSRSGTAIFVPSANLEAGTTYSATVTPEVSGVAGAALADTYGWSFTTGAVIDSTTPTVSATSPLDHAINVPVNQRVLAMFSKKMTPASLNRVTVKVTKPGGVAIMGVVTYASGAASLKPRYALAPNTHYIATITTGAKDLAGNPMASDYVWSFDTGANRDTVKPTVTSTNPTNGALMVPINQNVNATFSKVMNYASINTADFFLASAAGRVVGTITYFYDSFNKVTIATFVPNAKLRINTLYTATITTAARDLAGNPLAGDKPSGNNVWQFTTGSATGLATVPLGAAANFAILAAAAVTNTATPTAITGDIGLWPGTSMTGFPPGTVNGAIHVNDTTAQAGEAALAVAYNDARGRVGAFTPAVGNVGGLVFTPGLYRSGTSTAISGGGNLTLDAQGDPNAVFIFQIASTLTTSSGFGVTLVGGAKASHIFWQVGSSATIGVGSHFAGNILANTSITLVSGAVLDGRALAGAVSATGAVTMDDNTVVRPAS
jgi:ice-binding like protein/Big-like domain-containing protein